MPPSKQAKLKFISLASRLTVLMLVVTDILEALFFFLL